MCLPIAVLSLLVCSEAVRNSYKDELVQSDLTEPDEPPINRYVPFGHIFVDGFDDPTSDMKRPIDFLELSLKTPKTKEERERLLKETPPERILRANRKKYEVQDDVMEIKNMASPDKKNEVGARWFDFAGMNEKYLVNPPRNLPPQKSSKIVRKYGTGITNTDVGNFGLQFPNPYKEVKWTTCAEFSKKSSSFHPKDIVDVDWTPFYVWSSRKFESAVVHRFTYPTKKIVKQYKTLYGPHLRNRRLDWEQPKLVLNESIEMLLIADPKDRRGLFHGVPKWPLPKDAKTLKSIQYAVPKIRVKIVDPYLALMFCDDYYTTIMAAPGSEPSNKVESEEEAKVLNFTGIGYPVSRNYEAEKAAAWDEIRRQQLAEDAKYIKAYNVGVKTHM